MKRKGINLDEKYHYMLIEISKHDHGRPLNQCIHILIEERYNEIQNEPNVEIDKAS